MIALMAARGCSMARQTFWIALVAVAVVAAAALSYPYLDGHNSVASGKSNVTTDVQLSSVLARYCLNSNTTQHISYHAGSKIVAYYDSPYFHNFTSGTVGCNLPHYGGLIEMYNNTTRVLTSELVYDEISNLTSSHPFSGTYTLTVYYYPIVGTHITGEQEIQIKNGSGGAQVYDCSSSTTCTLAETPSVAQSCPSSDVHYSSGIYGWGITICGCTAQAIVDLLAGGAVEASAVAALLSPSGVGAAIAGAVAVILGLSALALQACINSGGGCFTILGDSITFGGCWWIYCWSWTVYFTWGVWCGGAPYGF